MLVRKDKCEIRELGKVFLEGCLVSGERFECFNF